MMEPALYREADSSQNSEPSENSGYESSTTQHAKKTRHRVIGPYAVVFMNKKKDAERAKALQTMRQAKKTPTNATPTNKSNSGQNPGSPTPRRQTQTPASPPALTDVDMSSDIFTDAPMSSTSAIQKVSTLLKNLLVTIGGFQQDVNTAKAVEGDADIKKLSLDLYKYINHEAHLEAETMKRSVHKQADTIHLLTKNLLKQHALPAHQQSGPMTAAPMANVTKSNNPTPIKPTRKSAPATKHKLPINAAQRGHENRLIIRFHPKLPESQRTISGLMLRELVNTEIQDSCLDDPDNPVPEHVRVSAVIWSNSGNPIVIGAEGCTAETLLRYEDAIIRALTPYPESLGQTDSIAYESYAHTDAIYYKVKINSVPTLAVNGSPQAPERVGEELARECQFYRGMEQFQPPAWLGQNADIATRSRGSVVVSLLRATDQDTLLAQKKVYLFGQLCSIVRYEELPPVWQCNKCGSLDHRTEVCKNGERCLICMKPTNSHSTANHPKDEPAKCINCNEPHRANDRGCPVRKKREGRVFTPGGPKKATTVKPKLDKGKSIAKGSLTSPTDRTDPLLSQTPGSGPSGHRIYIAGNVWKTATSKKKAAGLILDETANEIMHAETTPANPPNV